MEAWQKYLRETWGLSASFAEKVALLIAWLNYYGLSPRITSGFRDPKHQNKLRKQWDSGNRSGLRARPAVDSLHTRENWGRPDARAIDIVSTDEGLASRIAQALGVGSGFNFRTPDPGHYYELNA